MKPATMPRSVPGTERLLHIDPRRQGFSHHQVGDLASLLAAGDCIVVNDAGIVQGRLRGRALEETPEATAEEAMEIGPTTIRPNEPLEPLVERMHRRGVRTVIVSDLQGRLVGILYREDAERALEAARR